MANSCPHCVPCAISQLTQFLMSNHRKRVVPRVCNLKLTSPEMKPFFDKVDGAQGPGLFKVRKIP